MTRIMKGTTKQLLLLLAAVATSDIVTADSDSPAAACSTMRALAEAGEVCLATSSFAATETAAAAASFTQEEHDVHVDFEYVKDDDDFECELYMAPSTIPGAGLGIFTSRPLEPGQAVAGIQESGDVLLPVVDVHYHLLRRRKQQQQQEEETIPVEFTSDYVWAGAEMGMARESAWSDDGGVTAFCPGLDAAINCHLALINVDKSYPNYDSLNFHRSRDPGTGAFSPYHNCTTVATAHVPAGGELFKYYGEHWFLTREHWFPNIPLNDDYDRADELLHKFDQMVSQEINPALEEPIQRDLYLLLKRDLAGLWDKPKYQSRTKTIHALPSDFDLLHLARDRDHPHELSQELQQPATDHQQHPHHAHHTSTKEEKEGDSATTGSSTSATIRGIRATYQPAAIRPLDELERRGRCLTAVQVKRSTVQQAGRGVFARTSFKQGQVVTGTPLLLGTSDEFMTLYEGDWWNRTSPPSAQEYGKQLLLNYCYSHAESVTPLYLCPYGHLVNLINHQSNASKGGRGANIRPVWAPDKFLGQDNANLHMHPNAILETKKTASPGLFWDFVATRDIGKGEELFLDYGPAWEEAWNEHVVNFETMYKQNYDPNYMSAREYNVRYTNSIIPTETEQQQQQETDAKEQSYSYPDNLEIRCLNELGANYYNNSNNNNHHSSSWLTADEASALWTIDNAGSACRIFRRDELVTEEGRSRFVYTIDLEYESWDYALEDYAKHGMSNISNVPREAIRFVDVPYTTDLFLPFAFRHPIAIPDDMFPAAWRRNNSSNTSCNSTPTATTTTTQEQGPAGQESTESVADASTTTPEEGSSTSATSATTQKKLAS